MHGYSTCSGGTVLLRERDVLPMGVVTPVTYTHSPSGGVKELGAEVWTTPLTAEQWAMRDEPPDTGYRYRFKSHELEEIKRCHDEHGFALVEDVLSAEEVAALRADIERVIPASDIAENGSQVRHAFAEFSPAARQLLLNDTAMSIQQLLLGVTEGVNDDELTVHRSAAIVRRPGAGAGGASSPWHSDFTGYSPLPLMNASVHLNRGEMPNGKWYYLNGSHPRRGGLCIIAESHHPDYTPPPGFRWANVDEQGHGSGLQRLDKETGEWASATNSFDIPGVVPLYSNPGDMLIFAARTL